MNEVSVVPASLYEQAGFVHCADGMFRPAIAAQPQAWAYCDNEWGYPGRGARVSEQELFGFMSLLVFQAGMRWSSILARREQLAAALAGFQVDELATWPEEAVARIAQAPGMISNPRKIAAVLANARACLALRSQGGLCELVYSHTPARVDMPFVVRQCPESVALARALKQAGFRFVGPTSTYALLQHFGLVCDRP